MTIMLIDYSDCRLYFHVSIPVLIWIVLLLQLSWSHSGDRFVIVTNGRGSSVIMFAVDTSTHPGKTNLSVLWLATTGQIPASQPGHDLEASGTVSIAALSDQDEEKVDAFYMAEINPSGTCLAVEERGTHTHLHLYSSEGKLLKVCVATFSSITRLKIMFLSYGMSFHL